jgi:hypothetical protein
MNHDELLKLVRATSIDLMNKGEGDGTIYACYSDDEIIAEFGGKTEAQVIRKVRKLDKATASHFNDVRMFSGEYRMVNGVAVSIYELERQAEAKAEAEERAKAEALADLGDDLTALATELRQMLDTWIKKHKGGDSPARELAFSVSTCIHNTLTEQHHLLAEIAEQGISYDEWANAHF